MGQRCGASDVDVGVAWQVDIRVGKKAWNWAVKGWMPRISARVIRSLSISIERERDREGVSAQPDCFSSKVTNCAFSRSFSLITLLFLILLSVQKAIPSYWALKPLSASSPRAS